MNKNPNDELIAELLADLTRQVEEHSKKVAKQAPEFIETRRSRVDREVAEAMRMHHEEALASKLAAHKAVMDEYAVNPPETLLQEIDAEVTLSNGLHGAFHSHHEAYAVIFEELDEYWEEVREKTHDPARMRKELIQVAAMCVKTIRCLIDNR